MRYFLLCSVLSSFAIGADVWGAVTVKSDPSDVVLVGMGDSETGPGIRDGTVSWIGTTPSPTSLSAGYFFFQLPTPKPGELPIVTSANFSFNVVKATPVGAFALDLYGLATRAAPFDASANFPMINWASEHNFGANDATAVKIQDNLVPSNNTTTGWFETSASGNGALAEYLTDQYGPSGAGAGAYVLLRLNPDLAFAAYGLSPIAGPAGVLVEFSGIGPWDGEPPLTSNSATRPSLTLEFALVPEPTVALIWPVVVAGGLLLRRRR